MKRIVLIVAGMIVVAVLFVAYNSLFVVEQTEQALVLQFGQPVREIHDPGLQFKIPFTQDVVFYDRRILDYEPPAEEVIAADQKRLVVDSFALYKIVDSLQFYRTAGTEDNVRLRLGATISGSLRRILGGEVLARLLSPERAAIMAAIRDDVAAQVKSFGIEVIDVRIRRADLPSENSEAIYKRMKSERDREAKEFRAQGAEQAQGIKARADKEVSVILADANKQSQIVKGQGDAESIRISAEAFGQDPEFFAFYRSLEAYQAALGPGTTMVLSPDSDFFRYLSKRPPIGPAKP